MNTNYIKYITDQEMLILKKAIEKCKNPALKMALKLMIDTGLRIGEIVDLKRENFNSNFTIVNFIQKKNKRPHSRQISDKLAAELRLFNFIYTIAKRRRYETEFFFFSWGCIEKHRTKHIKTSQIRYFFLKFRRKYGLDDVYYTCKDGKKLYRISPHTVRHWYVYQLYKHTQNNLIAARDIIGHLDTKTTQRYCYAYDIKGKEQDLANKISVF